MTTTTTTICTTIVPPFILVLSLSRESQQENSEIFQIIFLTNLKHNFYVLIVHFPSVLTQKIIYLQLLF